MYPLTKVNKVLVVQVTIGIFLTKHTQYHMQMSVVKTFYSIDGNNNLTAYQKLSTDDNSKNLTAYQKLSTEASPKSKPKARTKLPPQIKANYL